MQPGTVYIRCFKTLNLEWKEHVVTDIKFMRPTDVKVVRANPAKAATKLGWKAVYSTCDVAKMMVEAELETSKPKVTTNRNQTI